MELVAGDIEVETVIPGCGATGGLGVTGASREEVEVEVEMVVGMLWRLREGEEMEGGEGVAMEATGRRVGGGAGPEKVKEGGGTCPRGRPRVESHLEPDRS